MKIDEMLKKAQTQLSDAQAALKNATATGESGAGLVKVTINGRFEALRVEIDPSLTSESISMLEDLVAAAFNDAVHRIEAMQKERVGEMARGMLPPGFKLPL